MHPKMNVILNVPFKSKFFIIMIFELVVRLFDYLVNFKLYAILISLPVLMVPSITVGGFTS